MKSSCIKRIWIDIVYWNKKIKPVISINMSKLINQGGYGCVYYPGFDAKDNTKIDD